MKNKSLIKILVSLVLLTVIFLKIDVGSVVQNFNMLNTNLIPILVLLIILNYVVSSVRWKLLLIHSGSEKISVPYLTSLYFKGSFFNNFMPTSIGGDVYKVVTLGTKIKSKTNAFSATFMERFTGVIALVIISYFGLVQVLEVFGLNISPEVLVILFFAGTAGVFYFLKIFSAKFSILGKVYNSLYEYRSAKGTLFWAFITSFIVQFLAIFTQFYVFKAMGVDLPLIYSLAVFPVITLASFVIPSLNGLGVQDALYIQLFSSIGVPVTVSLSASIVYHLLRLFVSLIGGVLYAFDKSS